MKCTRQSREACGVCRFEDFGLSPNLTASLQALYNNDIDSVDWFLGVLIEQPHLENTFLGEVSRPCMCWPALVFIRLAPPMRANLVQAFGLELSVITVQM